MNIERTFTPDEIDAMRDVVTAALIERGGKMARTGRSIRFGCPNPLHPDADPSADWTIETGVWLCRSRGCQEHMGGGGTIALARALGLSAGAGLTPEAEAAMEAAKASAAEARRRERENAGVAAERLVKSQYDRDCADRLHARPELLAMLAAEGLTFEALAVALVGVDDRPPIYGRWPSLSIPWLDADRPERLVSVQYRNLDPAAAHGDRYRWHGGIGQNGARIYNVDALRGRPDRVIVVEGAKKALALIGHGWPATVGLYNSTALGDEEAGRLAASGAEVVFLPDPDAFEVTRERARAIPGARIVRCPAKPDDYGVAAGWGVIAKLVNQARAA